MAPRKGQNKNPANIDTGPEPIDATPWAPVMQLVDFAPLQAQYASVKEATALYGLDHTNPVMVTRMRNKIRKHPVFRADGAVILVQQDPFETDPRNYVIYAKRETIDLLKHYQPAITDRRTARDGLKWRRVRMTDDQVEAFKNGTLDTSGIEIDTPIRKVKSKPAAEAQQESAAEEQEIEIEESAE